MQAAETVESSSLPGETAQNADYTGYIASAYGFAALVLGVMLVVSLKKYLHARRLAAAAK